MFKFTVQLLLVISIFLSNASHATIMFVSYANGDENGIGQGVAAEDTLTTDLLGVNFVEYQVGDSLFDLAWASPVNTPSWFGVNELNPAEAIENWTQASDKLIEQLSNESEDFLTKLFTKTVNGETVYINAVEYWNSVFTAPTISMDEDASVNMDDLLNGNIASALNHYPEKSGYESFDTFYVRAVEDRPDAQVPEPTTLMIFAIALIALSFRNRFAR